MDSNLVKESAKSWVALLDSLQTLGIDEELPVPQIVVFGDQSSGKSSLLESISGIPFPKGTGLVTRCPTRISMAACGPTEPWVADVKLPNTIAQSGIFNARGQVTTVEQLSKRLAEAAEIVCPPNSAEFSSEVIQVSVQSPTMPNLSLIDLPGIIRTTTAGQDRAVIANVDALLESFLRQPETVILAVIPANQDIATIDILERANIFDPAGIRTIGVLTKPDLIDRGGEDEVLKIVQNIRKPLKLGYVMVKNRSQAELKSSVSLAQSAENESAYFTNHEFWRSIAPNSRGIKPLCERLTNIIVSRAMDRGPTLKWYLIDKLNKTEAKLNELGIEIPDSDVAKSKTLMKIVARYAATLRQIAMGDYRDQLAQSNTELRIRYLVNQILDQLRNTLAANIPDLSDPVYAERLSTGISEMRGRLVPFCLIKLFFSLYILLLTSLTCFFCFGSELPGFGHTRLLLSTVADELETWQLVVDESISQVFNAYTSTANALAMKMASQVWFSRTNTSFLNVKVIFLLKLYVFSLSMV
jgi:interferon-induced GTP-binding protein Mx